MSIFSQNETDPAFALGTPEKKMNRCILSVRTINIKPSYCIELELSFRTKGATIMNISNKFLSLTTGLHTHLSILIIVNDHVIE